MSFQSWVASAAAGWAAFHFLRGAYRDLASAGKSEGDSCGSCSTGGCPVARKH